MPKVFSPGEPETRPLYPDEVVYTTAQKVADLLDIGPQDAILMSATADADAVYITGNELEQLVSVLATKFVCTAMQTHSGMKI